MPLDVHSITMQNLSKTFPVAIDVIINEILYKAALKYE